MTSDRRARQSCHGPSQGFVLIGVIMLVLALTILGLSLFSLSTYEAQFLNRSLERAQAFHAAMGGLERAKHALVTSEQLDAVRSDLPEFVDATLAFQEQSGSLVSSGNVEWQTGRPIGIRVRARYRDASRVFEGWFNPKPRDDYYKQLVTVASRCEVPDLGGGPPPLGPRRPQTTLDGAFWLGTAGSPHDTTWNDDCLPTGKVPIKVLDIPVPEVASYIANHRGGATLATRNGNSDEWSLGTSGATSFYVSTDDEIDTSSPYSVRATRPSPKISVAGTVVWMFDHGFRSDNPLVIQGTSSDCLIMVARQGYDPPYPIGVWFAAGVRSTGPHMILVSDEGIRVEHLTGLYDTQVNSLVIYSRDAWLMGPLPPGRMTLGHTSATDQLVDVLNAAGILPTNGPATKNQLALIPGSWREAP